MDENKIEDLEIIISQVFKDRGNFKCGYNISWSIEWLNTEEIYNKRGSDIRYGFKKA